MKEAKKCLRCNTGDTQCAEDHTQQKLGARIFKGALRSIGGNKEWEELQGLLNEDPELCMDQGGGGGT